MNDALHGADLAPDFCKNLFNLRGIRDVAAEGGKGHSLQRMGRQLAASVQQNHARAVAFMNLARQRLAHAPKTAGHHHATVLCDDRRGSRGRRRRQLDQLTHTHSAIVCRHIRPVNQAEAGRKGRYGSCVLLLNLHIGAGNSGFFPWQAEQRPHVQRALRQTFQMRFVGGGIRHKGPAAHNGDAQRAAQTAVANLLQQGAERPCVVLPVRLQAGQPEQMVCGASKDFTRQCADFIRMRGQGTARVGKRLQGFSQKAALPAKQDDVLRHGNRAFQIGLFPANGVQFRLRLRNIQAGSDSGLPLAQGHKGHAFKLRNNLAGGVRHRAVGHNHALLAVSNTHKRKGLRGQGAVEPHHAATSGHKTVNAAQGKACGNVHHGRMPAEGI